MTNDINPCVLLRDLVLAIKIGDRNGKFESQRMLASHGYLLIFGDMLPERPSRPQISLS